MDRSNTLVYADNVFRLSFKKLGAEHRFPDESGITGSNHEIVGHEIVRREFVNFKNKKPGNDDSPY